MGSSIRKTTKSATRSKKTIKAKKTSAWKTFWKKYCSMS